MKLELSAIFLIIFISILQSCNAENENHTVTWGELGQGDKLLHRQIIRQEYKLLRVAKEDYEYETPSTIHFIRAVDQYINGNGGYAMLTKGGPGYNYVNVHFKSQFMHGFNFILEIYGH